MCAYVRRSPSELSLDGADDLPHYEGTGLLNMPMSFRDSMGDISDISPASSAPITPANGTIWRTLVCPGAPLQLPEVPGSRISPSSLASSAAPTPRLRAWTTGSSTPSEGSDKLNNALFPITPQSSQPFTPANAASTQWRMLNCPGAPPRRNSVRRSRSAESSAPRTPADTWPSALGTPTCSTPLGFFENGVPEPAALRLAICGAKLDLATSRRLSGIVGDLFDTTNSQVRAQSADGREDDEKAEESDDSPPVSMIRRRRRVNSLQLSISDPTTPRRLRQRANTIHILAAVPEDPGPSPEPTPLFPNKVDWEKPVVIDEHDNVDAADKCDCGSPAVAETQREEVETSSTPDALIDTPSPKKFALLTREFSGSKAPEACQAQAPANKLVESEQKVERIPLMDITNGRLQRGIH